MRGAYARDASLSLDGFLRPEVFARVRAGMGAQRWQHVGPPILHSYKHVPREEGAGAHDAALSDASGGGEGGSGARPAKRGRGAGGDDGSGRGSAAGAAAASRPLSRAFNGILPDAVHRLRAFLTGAPFYEYVSLVTGAALDGVSDAVRCFAHGDYTLLSDPAYKAQVAAAKAQRAGLVVAAGRNGGGGSGGRGGGGSGGGGDDEGDDDASLAGAAPLLDVTLCCVGSSEEWDDAAGGCVTYMTADDELLTVPPKANALSLVCREPGVMSFVRFVSHAAPEPRYDVALQFRTLPAPGGGGGDDDEEEEEEDGEEDEDA
jgi:hypothetical protein